LLIGGGERNGQIAAVMSSASIPLLHRPSWLPIEAAQQGDRGISWVTCTAQGHGGCRRFAAMKPPPTTTHVGWSDSSRTMSSLHPTQSLRGDGRADGGELPRPRIARPASWRDDPSAAVTAMVWASSKRPQRAPVHNGLGQQTDVGGSFEPIHLGADVASKAPASQIQITPLPAVAGGIGKQMARRPSHRTNNFWERSPDSRRATHPIALNDRHPRPDRRRPRLAAAAPRSGAKGNIRSKGVGSWAGDGEPTDGWTGLYSPQPAKFEPGLPQGRPWVPRPSG